MGLGIDFVATAFVLLIGKIHADSHGSVLSCPSGWTYLDGDKCYKVFQGQDERTWYRADEICKSYGSRLATFKDQIENNHIGELVNAGVTDKDKYKSYWIGVSCPDKNCDPSGAFDSYGRPVLESQGNWADGQPDFTIGQCVYTKKNDVDYVYDKSYVQSMDHCSVKRSFVCERTAAPANSFHCFSGGYVDLGNRCDGNRDCTDASDEANCPNYCHYYYQLASGKISMPVNQQPVNYGDSQTCTWALEAPLGSNIFINFTSFNTEQGADFVQVYVGSIVEMNAVPVASLSGQPITNQIFRSHNNMMFIKFSSDSQGNERGFTAVFGSVATSMASTKRELVAYPVPVIHSTILHDVGGVSAFVGMTDYVYVISAASQYQIVTVEVLDPVLGEDDKVVFYDGDSPHKRELLTLCKNCPEYYVVSSTGKYLSIHLITDKPVESSFRFRYKQGCDVKFNSTYGTLFTPGYMGNIYYPQNIICTWTIEVDRPISIYFEQDLSLDDSFTCIKKSNDYLQIFEGRNAGVTALHTGDGFSSVDLRSRTFQSSSGRLFLKFVSTSTRNARGFMARWSQDCEDPMFDSNTKINAGTIMSAPFHYTATMTLTCATGYSFQQEQISSGVLSVPLTCSYKGMWNYPNIPRCTPNYCGDVPDITSGYIENSSGSVYGSVATYKCYPGSTLISNVGPIGNNQISCQSNGQWQTPPTCQTASCNVNLISLNPPNGNGVIRSGTGNGAQIGSIVDYTCDEGYEMEGEPILICQENGQWSANNPTCRRKTCLLPTIPNGFVNPSTSFINFGDIASVTCASGYVYEDSAVTTLSCQADRTLTALPVCVDENECDRTPKPCGSHCTNTVGSYNCYCDPGFDLQADQISCADRNECLENEDTCDEGCSNIPGGYTCSCTLPKVLFTEDGTSGYLIPFSETGLLPTDTYRLNQSCVLIECSSPASIANGVLLTQRLHHRYGDYIEYRCNLGYNPRSAVLHCGADGSWIGGPPPTCVPATCPNDILGGGLQNQAAYKIGPYSYQEELDLNCTVATEFFQKRRNCVYNRGTDQYELQGSSYECGVINCGQPEAAAGSSYVVFNTLYGNTFEFTCAAGNSPTGSSTQTGISRTVTCEADGYWNFGNLQCFSQSCDDPGYPAGGEMIATSFSDRSVVTFNCTKPGYTLSHSDSLLCQGTTWNGTVPSCIDTTPPNIGIATGQSCAGSYSIAVQRYSLLSSYLPQIVYSDNDGIKSFVVDPPNANSTLYLEFDQTVTYTVTDYSDNQASCSVRFLVRDDTPPTIVCPPLSSLTLYLEDSNDTASLNITSDMFIVNDDSGIQNLQPVEIISRPPTSFTFADLYKTYTFTATVRDQRGNAASCQAQVFVTTSTCSPNSYPTPLNAVKVCTPFGQGYSCVITCDPLYHFENSGGLPNGGKQRTVTCQTNFNAGTWSEAWIPACVRDVTYPEITCPSSQTIFFSNDGDSQFVDYTLLSYTVSDLNTITDRTFTPESHTFTPDDMYRAKEIVLNVRDAAGLQSTCKFQYLVLPRTCSPLSYPTPVYGNKSDCVRNALNTGYRCRITCDAGYVLQSYSLPIDATYTDVDCIDNFGWDEVIPACVQDNIPPTISCPSSKTLYLESLDDYQEVEFGTFGVFDDFMRVDSGGIKNTYFLPSSYNFTRNNLYNTQSVTFIAEDSANNQARCAFTVRVLPAACSPLSLPQLANGHTECTRQAGGWSCQLTCDSGYGFSHTTDIAVTLSCTTGVAWSGQVPGCSILTDTQQTIYFGQYRYLYQPVSGITSVNTSCGPHYLDQQSRTSVSIDGGTKTLYQSMADRMLSGCKLYTNVAPGSQLTITFVPNLFEFSVTNVGGTLLNRQVIIHYTFTMTSLDIDSLNNCKSWLMTTLPIVPSGYEFSRNIPGDGGICGELSWDNQMNQESEGYRCLGNYFISPHDNNLCRPCPWGSISDSTSCSVCPKGTYHSSPSSDVCSPCGSGRTTRYSGATSSSACVAECVSGQISEDGYQPCWSCPVGTYATSLTTCTSCGSGRTTSVTGASSDTACFDIVPQKEPCGQGTQANGDTCELCPLGTYRNLLLSQCISCNLVGTTTFVTGAVANSSCYGMCGGGLTSSDGRPPCTACPKGTYYFNSTYCESCPTGRTTRYVGASSISDCRLESFLRVKCPRGTFRDGDVCTKCAIGYYSSVEDVSQCSSCPSGYLTYQEGATSQAMCFAPCSPGFRSATGLSPCSPCGKGSYSASPTSCVLCGAGTTTKMTTAASSSECIAQCGTGKFSVSGYNHDNTPCRNCPANYYQDLTGQTACKQCSANQYTTLGQTGLKSSSDCIGSAQTFQELCPLNRCVNGGNCTVQNHDFYCSCASGYYGRTCSNRVNFCQINPCFNGGACTNTDPGPVCNCGTFATGPRCENVVKTCTAGYCQNGGHCRNFPGRRECLCSAGYTGATCANQAQICNANPCLNGGNCFDTSFGYNIRRKCICPTGYTGVNCETQIDFCASTPCLYGAQCIPLLNDYQCQCPAGYRGKNCELRQDRCQNYNCGGGVCVDDYTEDEPRCICSIGWYFGVVMQYTIKLDVAGTPLPSQPTLTGTLAECRDRCNSDGTCASFTYRSVSNSCYIWSSFSAVTLSATSGYNHYEKETLEAADDYWTPWYDVSTPANSNNNDDTERREDLINMYGLNVCEGTMPISWECADTVTGVAPGFGITCTADGLLCSGATPCADYKVRYKCAAHRVFKNNQCRQRDNCSPNPCPNNRPCTSYGETYRCSCSPGFTGRDCQTNIDDCASKPCKNNGTCQDQIQSYHCDCPPSTGYTGRNCDVRIDYCLGKTCNFRGTCNLLLTDYQCSCSLGYEGKDCENEVDHCVSAPCLHGGTCHPRFNDYYCECPDGWKGKNCDQIVDKCLQGGNVTCQAECYYVFNDYYCKCPANTYGRNCENQPNPCGDYNKCLNGGNCSYNFKDMMRCSCDMRYTGDGCQTLVDLCSASSNKCQNGGTCSVTSTGYECTCAPGYTGNHCEDEIDECAGVICPGGTCFDDIGQHYCRCDRGKTGANCRRNYDPNYDIYFNHPQGLNYAWVPFPNQVTNATDMSVSLWVRFAEAGSTGTFFTMFVGDRLRSSMKFMEFRHDGVKIFLSTDNDLTDHTMLRYTYNFILNNGNWHYIVFNYDLANGKMVLTADSIKHTEIENTALVVSPGTFRFWVVIGCEFDQTDKKCMLGNRFHGFVSQVNYYSRQLDFNTEIPKINLDPQKVFDPFINVLLLWNEYLLETGSDRIIPSEADVSPCPGRCKTYSVLSRPTLSSSNPCPDDMIVYSQGRRLTLVSWDEPVFEGAVSMIRPEYQSGFFYHVGVYQIIYIAIGVTNNKAVCSFKLYVQSSQCDSPVDPLGGVQSCTVDPTGYKQCELGCFNSNSYVTDRLTPYLFTCGPTGNWNAMKPFNKFTYPPCGEQDSLPARAKLTMRVAYTIATTTCESALINFNGRIFEQFNKQLNDRMNGELCNKVNCSDLNVDIECGQAQDDTISLVEVTIPDCVQKTVIDGKEMLTEDFITCSVLGADILNFNDTIPGGNIDPVSYLITSTLICQQPNRVLIDGKCVECGPGTYYLKRDDKSPAFCEDCPIGKYQDLAGQASCKSCDAGYTTEMTGSSQAGGVDCKEICGVGNYYSIAAGRCIPCEVGYFQDEEGQFFCKFCERGQTTSDPGAVSRSQCQETCPSGEQLVDNGCVKCEIGFYRNESESRLCKPCPGNKITTSTGAISRDDCTVEACEAGYRLDVPSNTCEKCPLGYYQDKKWMTVCLSCGDPNYWRTDNEGSADPKDCKFYCPPGQVAQDVGSPNPYCLPCPIGAYRNNDNDFYGQCVPCSGNYRTESVGSVSQQNCTIYLCPAGEKPDATNTMCEKCPLGTYQSIPGSTNCISCDSGESTRDVGSALATDCEIYCPSGEEKLATGVCDPCLRGSWKDNANGLFSTCAACPTNYTTAGNGTQQEAECTIRDCPAGTRRNPDDTDCITCELGTYQSLPLNTTCVPCQTGHSTRDTGSTSSNQCETYCIPGTEKNSAGGCDDCPRGYYKDNSHGLFSTCELCPLDKITPKERSTSINNCTIGNCSAGYKISANNDCEICPKGTYQDQKWETVCINCGPDKTTQFTGADREDLCILECPPGKEDINETCMECPRGFYKKLYLAAACDPCPDGYTTEITGAINVSLCSVPACKAGQYLDRTSSPLACKMCNYDTYQDGIWQEECKPCPDGKVTFFYGAESESMCVENCTSGYEYNAATMGCDECPIGFYRNQFNRAHTMCQMCDINFITATDKSDSVNDCTVRNCTAPGYYRNVDRNQCEQCPLGTYLNQKWQIKCIDCPANHSTLNKGSTSVADCRRTCPAGQYLGANNECRLCAIGTYRTGLSGENCNQCPDRLLTPRLGAESDSECTVSPCLAGEYYVRNLLECKQCDRGYYQNEAGKFQCIVCPYTVQYTPAKGAASVDDCRSPCGVGQELNVQQDRCEPCSEGFYQDNEREFSCKQCPPTKSYTSGKGSASFEDCQNRCDVGNDCSTNATCSNDPNAADGYTCTCFRNYKDVLGNGRNCLHVCDTGVCQHNSVCNRNDHTDGVVTCTCTEWYTGAKCETRFKAEDLADKPLDIAIPVGISVGAFLLILGIIATACFVASRRSSPKPIPQYSEFTGDRVEKTSLYSQGYGQTPFNQKVMLAPGSEMVYDNQAYVGPDAAVYTA